MTGPLGDNPPPPDDAPARVPMVYHGGGTPQLTKTNETGAAVGAASARAQVEMARIVAANRPRSIEVFRDDMLKACLRFKFADGATYEKPVGGGKMATGLSIRFAEEASRNFRNLHVEISVVSEDDEQRIIAAVAIDLENNVTHSVQAVVPKYVERTSVKPGDFIISQRQNSRGMTTYRVPATADAMFTEHQRAAAKAKREVILALIPSDIKEECEEQIVKTMRDIGDKDPEAYLKSMLDSFFASGVTEEQVHAYLGKSPQLMNVAERHQLRRIYQGIKQGETTWTEVMALRRADRVVKAEATVVTSQGTAATKLREAVATTPPVTILPRDTTDDDLQQEELELLALEAKERQ